MTESERTAEVRPISGSAPIEPAEWEGRLAKLSKLLAGIAQHADLQMMSRCPYRNRLDQCTSSFGCRNKRKPEGLEKLPRCAGDAGIDYRSAWEVEPDGYEPLRRSLRRPATRHAPARESARAAP